MSSLSHAGGEVLVQCSALQRVVRDARRDLQVSDTKRINHIEGNLPYARDATAAAAITTPPDRKVRQYPGGNERGGIL